MGSTLSAKKIVVIGAGGSGRETLGLIRDINLCKGPTWEFIGFVAEHPGPPELLDRLHADWLGRLGDPGLQANLPRDCWFVAAIGDGQIRRRVEHEAQGLGLQLATLVHPEAIIGEDVILGQGSVVCAGAILTTNVRIGRSNQANIGCTVSHDANLGDYVTLAPAVSLAGNVSIGDGATLYTKTSVIPGVKVGANAIVGAGSVVIREVAAGTTVVGCPAHEVRRP